MSLLLGTYVEWRLTEGSVKNFLFSLTIHGLCLQSSFSMVLLEDTLFLDHMHMIRSTFLVILFYGVTLNEFQMNISFWFGLVLFSFVLFWPSGLYWGLKVELIDFSCIISLWNVSISLFQLSSFTFSSEMCKLHIFLRTVLTFWHHARPQIKGKVSHSLLL